MEGPEAHGRKMRGRRKLTVLCVTVLTATGVLVVVLLALRRWATFSNSPSGCMAQFASGVIKNDPTLIKEYADQRNLDYLELHDGTISPDTRTFLAAELGVQLPPVMGDDPLEYGVGSVFSVRVVATSVIVTNAKGQEAYRLSFSQVSRDAHEATVRLSTFQAPNVLGVLGREEPRPSYHALFKMELEGKRWRPKSGVVAFGAGQEEIPIDFAALAESAGEAISRSRIVGNQAGAYAELLTLNRSAAEYERTYGCGFPRTLAAFGPPPTGQLPTRDAAGLVSKALAAGVAEGYTFTYEHGPSDRSGCVSHYAINADPATPGTTGNKHYYTDESGVVREREGEPADRTSPHVTDVP